MALHELEQPRVDRRPDADSLRWLGRVWGRLIGDGSDRGHVLDRNDDLHLHRLSDAGVDDGDWPRSVLRLSAEESRDLVERALGCRKADSLWWRVCDLLESLQRKRQVRSTLGPRDRVDLVDDDPSDAP